jgi:hypothetical protein
VPSLLMGDPGVSVGLALVHSMNPWQGDPYRAAMGRAREVSKKPLLVVTPGGMPEAERSTYLARGIDVFTDTDILLEGIGALLTAPPEPMGQRSGTEGLGVDGRDSPGHDGQMPGVDGQSPGVDGRDSPGHYRPSLGVDGRPLRGDAALGVDGRGRLGHDGQSLSPARQLTEPESLRLLAEYGVPTVPTVECGSAADAVAAAAGLGYPVVLKGVADGVAHKSDLGLVHVGLRDADAMAAAYAAVDCPRVVLQAMIRGDVEAIAGVTRADGVGLVMIAGLGGIFAEALHDVATFPLPVSRGFIEAGLAKGSLGRVLASPRWKYPDTGRAFVDLLMSLQEAALALGDGLQAIDINPVILGGDGAIAVDALVIASAGEAP